MKQMISEANMEKNSKTIFGNDPRVQVEYSQAKNLLHEKKALQKRLREVDKHLRDLRIVSVAATECAVHDLAYEANASTLPAMERLPTLHKLMSPRAFDLAV
jgi:hypothetical protein